MSYCTRERIETAIPAPHLVDALDDDRDGEADAAVLAELLASADQAVDSYLAGLFAVPFPAPTPAVVAEASFVFACERVYDRRQVAERNPWTSRANDMRERLKAIGSGKAPLEASRTKAVIPGRVVTEDSRIDGTMS